MNNTNYKIGSIYIPKKHYTLERPLKYLLDNYLGLDNKQIKKIKNSKSRWVCIQRTFPLSVINEKDCYILNNND